MKRKKDKLSKLQQKFKKKLKGAQFRWINEELYTKDSEISYKEMNKQRTSSRLVFFFFTRTAIEILQLQVLKRIIKDLKSKYANGQSILSR